VSDRWPVAVRAWSCSRIGIAAVRRWWPDGCGGQPPLRIPSGEALRISKEVVLRLGLDGPATHGENANQQNTDRRSDQPPLALSSCFVPIAAQREWTWDLLHPFGNRSHARERKEILQCNGPGYGLRRPKVYSNVCSKRSTGCAPNGAG
jgi:hypothetical protein